MISPASSSLAHATDLVGAASAAPREAARAARATAHAQDTLVAAPPRSTTSAVARGTPSSTASARAASTAGWADAATAVRASVVKPSAAKATAASATASDPLAFLHDSKLSVEEKLMRLLAYLNGKWEKEMNKKLDEIGGGTAASKSASGSASKPAQGKTSLLGSIAGAAKQFLPAVGIALDALKNPTVRAVATKIGGPVLAAAATAMGFPALAPALLKYAPKVIDVAAGVAAELDPASSKPASGAGSSASSASSTKGGEMSDSDRQLKLMEIQRIQEKQKEMFQLVSNVLRSGHDLRMSIVGNLR